MRDGAEIFEKFYKWNKGFVSITEKNLNFSTPSGRAMLGILQVFNQFERGQTAENTRNKMISIAAAGGWPAGNAPFGYERRAKRNADIVRRIFEEYVGDIPLYTIAKKYGKTAQGILIILRNEIYLGKVPYAGQIYNGRHEALITPKLFEAVRTGPRSAEGIRLSVNTYIERITISADETCTITFVPNVLIGTSNEKNGNPARIRT